MAVTVLRMITEWFTYNPPTPQPSSPQKELEQKAFSPTSAAAKIPTRVPANLPPTSVLKRRNPGERRRRDSLEPRVTFTESANGKVATSYYYYNPSQQANQKAVPSRTKDLQQTPVAVHRAPASRLPTPYHFEKQQQHQSSNGDKRDSLSSFPTFNKENLPKIPPLSYSKSHSPGQKEIRAAMGPVTSALRKRRIELESLANGSEKKRRIPVLGTRSAPSLLVQPNKRRERHELVWEHLNKRPKKDEKSPSIESNGDAHVNPPHATALKSAPAPTAHFSQSQTSSVQFKATDNVPPPSFDKASTTTQASVAPPTSNFQFGATGASSSSGAQLNSLHKNDSSASISSSAFNFGSTVGAPSSSQIEPPPVNGFKFGTGESSSSSQEGTTPTANSSFQFGSKESTQVPTQTETNATAATPSFAFGTTSASSSSEIPPPSFQLGNSLPSSTSTSAPQPAFKFGSSAENTPAPWTCLEWDSPPAFGQQSSSSFQLDNVTNAPSFGMTANAAPSFDATSSFAPSFGATAAQAPVFGMGPPAGATNNARTRRLARRGRRVA